METDTFVKLNKQIKITPKCGSFTLQMFFKVVIGKVDSKVLYQTAIRMFPISDEKRVKTKLSHSKLKRHIVLFRVFIRQQSPNKCKHSTTICRHKDEQRQCGGPKQCLELEYCLSTLEKMYEQWSVL